MEKIWVVEDPDEYLSSQKTARIAHELPLPAEKNPAAAYSLSLFFWGAGQIYNGQKEKGLWFLFAMLLSYTGAVLSLVYGKPLLHVLRSYGVSSLVIFMAAEVLLFCALVFWNYNADDAYQTAVRARKTPFTEVSSRVYPFLCSLLIPGWGQHLNGQPVKGSIFTCCSIFSLFSVISIPVTLLAWPSLEASAARTTIEGIFTLMVLFAPLIPLLWLFGSFDALKVSIDDIKKEPFFDRRLDKYVDVVKGEAMVRFSPGATKESVEKFNSDNKSKTIESYEKIGVYRLKISKSWSSPNTSGFAIRWTSRLYGTGTVTSAPCWKAP